MSALPDRGLARRHLVAVAVATAIAVLGASSAVAAFSSQAGNQDNELRAAADLTAPTVPRSVFQKIEGGVPGYVRQGGGVYVFAQLDESGNPASGVDEATAVTAAGSEVPLVAGDYMAAGQVYNYRSTLRSMSSPLAAANYAYTVMTSDAAGNDRVESGFSYVVDNTAPAGSGIDATNRPGGTLGRPELGDTVRFTYSEQIDAHSIISGWLGAGTQNVVVRINNNAAAGSSDQLVVYNGANNSQLPLGAIDLNRNDYVTSNTTFGASGTPSTLSQSGGEFTITLGTAAGTVSTGGGNATMAWVPSNVAFDRAGNRSGTATVNESGSNDRNF
jgi:hypothetical protein